MRVAALVNDTIGTLAGGRYDNPDVIAAVILGTGTNAAYVERAHVSPKWHGLLPKSGEMVSNFQMLSNVTQSSTKGLPVNVDRMFTSNFFEKIISGKYLGEILRRVLCRMADEAAFFGDTVPPKLKIPFILRTPDMSAMHHDTSSDLKVVGSKLKNILEVSLSYHFVIRRELKFRALRLSNFFFMISHISNTSLKTRKVIAELCEIIYALESTIKELLGEASDSIVITHSNDGSGIGCLTLPVPRG
ncbi:hypothetical protein RHMOL_Rhmol05G0035200 [Rhododendron molle]|uniref:Uncharacterized protein n=1 Tax=Rhododendron molle TaxID=49168 RepID=A0ACC0NM48_RHOML|nr:hypothetical protein RHMOL_Rhmol05G0035200 [Rhododendron molle]